MSVFNSSNFKKSIYYLRRNGMRKTLSAVKERLCPIGQPSYDWTPLPEEERKRQQEHVQAGFDRICFSIVVPLYCTPREYLSDMITSVIKQTYSKWELILADATEDTELGNIVECYNDSRIRYFHLSSNEGISGNTNRGIAMAGGDYVGLLDHDDLLTEDALYEMALRISQEREKGVELQVLYSDEDKWDESGQKYYDPNIKEKFNLDLLLSNNYICHFMVMRRELIQKLRLRIEYEGAQDFDLVLRAAGHILNEGEERQIAHVPKVLYHWRCHSGSTAQNPQSKRYAYDAGRRAVQDFVDSRGWKACVVETEHLGFYRLIYEGDIFRMRPQLGALGGTVVQKGKIAGGRLNEEGKIFYEGLPLSYSGYLHRAVLQQEAEALDIRNIEVRKELRGVFEQVVGVPYVAVSGTGIFDASTLPPDLDILGKSAELGAVLRKKGYRLVYLPEREKITIPR